MALSSYDKLEKYGNSPERIRELRARHAEQGVQERLEEKIKKRKLGELADKQSGLMRTSASQQAHQEVVSAASLRLSALKQPLAFGVEGRKPEEILSTDTRMGAFHGDQFIVPGSSQELPQGDGEPFDNPNPPAQPTLH